MTGPVRRDVISVLTHDHREVEELIGRLEATTPDDGLVRRELIDQLIIELAQHSVTEELYLHPATRKKLPRARGVRYRRRTDLSRVEKTLKALEQTDADTEEFARLLGELIGNVRRHVRAEEEHLFPALADRLSPAELTDLGDKVRAAKDRLPTRPHPLTPNRPPPSKMFAPGAALFDRVREHLSDREAVAGASVVRTYGPS